MKLRYKTYEEGKKIIWGFILLYWPVIKHFTDLKKTFL